jgi:hypothetical protein
MSRVVIAALDNPAAKAVIDDILAAFANPMVSGVAGVITIPYVIQDMIQDARSKHTLKEYKAQAKVIIEKAHRLAEMYNVSDREIVVKWPAWSK